MDELRCVREEQEYKLLRPWAAHSRDSLGRKRPEAPCPVRTCFQRDCDRILHSKSFRRLKHKTQVFIAPEGDHYRTRLTHTLEVSQIARTMARALDLNEDLTEAISLGHDLGHTPFGHAGEKELAARTNGEFTHNKQSLRVVERLERDGAGLNLTREVCDGILHHSGSSPAFTIEGQIVHRADRIAYINHDIDDACRAGILDISDIPPSLLDVLGSRHSERINTLILDIITASRGSAEVRMTPSVERAMNELRAFMFEHVYRTTAALEEEVRSRAVVGKLFEYYTEHPSAMPEPFCSIINSDGLVTAVCDYVAGMTDRYALKTYTELFIPHSWSSI
ncbi:MAG: deoxyguanosinetriphosphate triphosphohydrolase [Clostridia bacterium]